MAGYEGIKWDDIRAIGADFIRSLVGEEGAMPKLSDITGGFLSMLSTFTEDEPDGEPEETDETPDDSAPAPCTPANTYGIYLGGTAASISPEAVTAAADGLANLLRTAYECHLDQPNVRLAIKAYTKSLTPATSPGCNGATVSNADIRMGA